MSRALLVLASLLAVASFGAELDEDELSLLQTVLDKRLSNASSSKPLPINLTFPALQPPKVFNKDFPVDGNGKASSSSGPSAPTPSSSSSSSSPFDNFRMRDVVAEYIAMTLFVFIGCGSAMAIAKDEGSAWVLQVALAFGFAITVLAYSLGRYSGGQINCAVTLALWVYGTIGWAQALFNFVAQMLGSITGAILLCMMFPKAKDKTGGLGCNAIAPGHGPFGVLVGEFLMTFLLLIVVFESAKVAGPASGVAVICIGLAVFLAHCVLIPVDGCSINPTRSFGPACIATLRDGKVDHWADMWVFWVGPCLGGFAAAGVHTLFQL